MSEQHKRGWIWSDEEKEWLAGEQPRLRGKQRHMWGQVRYFKEALPRFSTEVAAAASRLLEACYALLAIDCSRSGRKYQPISCDEARMKLEAVAQGEAAWNIFTRREDILAAIKETNRDIRRRNRELKQEREQAKVRFEESLHSPPVEEFLRKHVEAIHRDAQRTIPAIAAFAGHTQLNEQDQERLTRLCIIRFIRDSMVFNCDVRAAVEQRCCAADKPQISEIMLIVLRDFLRRDAESPILQMASKEPPVILSVKAHLEPAISGLLELLRRRKTMAEFPNSEFKICGIDFSAP